MSADRAQVLFTGYAGVHYLCFKPIHQCLVDDGRVDVWLSGGKKRKEGDKIHFDVDGFYDDLASAAHQVISLEEAAKKSFDVHVAASLSADLIPGSAARSVQIFHGVSFKNYAVREKALKFDDLCLPGSYHVSRFQDAGLIRSDGSRCLVTGFAKTDPLALQSLDRDALLRGLELNPDLKTILYAPTGDKHNSLETVGEEFIAAVDRAGEWNLLVKPHDHPKKGIDWMTQLAPLESERVRIVRDVDVIPYLSAADLLVSDASSVAVEYTLMDRPIVFIDVPKLLKRVKKRGAPLDLTTFGRDIGEVAGSPDEVVAAIRDGLARPGDKSEIRRTVASKVFHGQGGAAARVAGVILHAAGLEETLPGDVEVVAPDAA